MARPKKAETEGRKLSTRERVKRLVKQGKSTRDIAKRLGTCKSTVVYHIQALRKDPDFIAFQKNKAEALEALQLELYRAIDPGIIKTMLERRGLTDLAILQDKIAVLRGQPTTIADVDLRGLIALVARGGIQVQSGAEEHREACESLLTLCEDSATVDSNDPPENHPPENQ